MKGSKFFKTGDLIKFEAYSGIKLAICLRPHEVEAKKILILILSNTSLNQYNHEVGKISFAFVDRNTSAWVLVE